MKKDKFFIISEAGVNHKVYMINSLHVRSDFLYKKSLVSFDLVNTGLGIWKRVVSLFLKKVEFFLKFHLL